MNRVLRYALLSTRTSTLVNRPRCLHVSPAVFYDHHRQNYHKRTENQTPEYRRHDRANSDQHRNRNYSRRDNNSSRYNRQKNQQRYTQWNPRAPLQDPDQASTPIYHDTVNPSTPFHASFTNNRIRVKRVAVTIGGVSMLIVERGIVGLDDVVYAKRRSVWEHIPRGQARVFIDPSATPDDPERSGAQRGNRPAASGAAANSSFQLAVALEGLRKFGYADSSYGYADTVTSAFALEKNNGECGHLSAFVIKGQRYWFVGSKNVHIVVRYDVPDEDLEAYNEGFRYKYARKIADLWRQTMRAHADPTKIAAFHAHLTTHAQTACFEAIFPDSQHLVDYYGACELRMHAITHEGPSSEGLCMGIMEAGELVRGFGLCFAAISERVSVGTPEYAALLDDIARRENSEGVVMYGCDAAGKVVRLWKEKSYPYTMERSAREAIVTNRYVGEGLRTRLRRKLAMQPAAVRHYFENWELKRLPWLISFAAWLHVTQRLRPSMTDTEVWDLRNRYLDVQREYLDEHNLQVLEKVRSLAESRSTLGAQSRNPPDVVMLAGCQGCGKSTLGRALYALLRQANYTPRWVNQDETGDRRAYLSAIEQAVSGPQVFTHLILDKMNLDDRMRSDYANLEVAVTVAWTHPDGTDALVGVCTDRVTKRGAAHRTLKIENGVEGEERRAEEKRIHGIIARSAHSYSPPTDSTVCEVDILHTASDTVRQVWKVMQEQGSNPLPDIDTLDMAAALDTAFAYEKLLDEQPRRALYGAIQIDDVDAVPRLVPAEMLRGKNVQREFHVTTKYFANDQDPVLFVALARRLGETIQLRLKEVVSDSKATAISVFNDNEFPCGNTIAHITVATADRVPAKYSNDLLADAEKNPSARYTAHPLLGTTLTGTFRFVFN